MIHEDLESGQCGFLLLSEEDEEPCRAPSVYRYTIKQPSEAPRMWWASPGFQSRKFRFALRVEACEFHRLENKDAHPHMRDPIEKWVSKTERVNRIGNYIPAYKSLKHTEELQG